MRKFFLFSLVFLLVSEGFSQTTIKGKVMDAVSGELLDRALIKTRGNMVTSDKNGNFTMQVPMGEYVLVASLDGYDNDSIDN